MGVIMEISTLEQTVRREVSEVATTDIHTHLFPPAHGELLLWGVDELLTYHYLVAELFTVAPRELTPEAFWKMPKTTQADLVWEHVFLKHGALSEAARGVITVLNRLGLDVTDRDLNGAREYFAAQNKQEYMRKVFEIANIDYAVMTNDPFQPTEAEHWNSGAQGADHLKPALRIDTLILDWPQAAKTMRDTGYETPDEAGTDGKGFAEARRFLTDWAKKMNPVYLAASLPPEFAYPVRDASTTILDEVVLPVARDVNVSIALMIGVRKQVNPILNDGGDAVGIADVTAVTSLCGSNSDNKFLITMLSRVNQHELCVAARKFRNLHLFGCWWFCNNPSIIEEMTRERLELLGATFTAQHSDARVLDHLIYKWAHTRTIVADVLVDKYRDLFLAGWRPTQEEIKRDVRALFGGAFEEFLAK